MPSYDEKPGESTQDRASRYFEQWRTWRADLEPYWEEIDKAQEMYEFYKREYSETSSEVALNTPFSIIESMVSRFNETTMAVTAQPLGVDGLDDFEKYVSNIVHDALEDSDVARYKGTFRKIKEVVFREFLVKGNVFNEVNYLYKVSDRSGKVLADNPYNQILPYKSVVFNPAYPADASPIYYLEKHISYADLMADEEREEEVTNPDGKKSKTMRGKYTNLDQLKEFAKKENKIIDSEDDHFVSDGNKLNRKVEPIKLIERWEGDKLCVLGVVGKHKTIIREAIDPKKTGDAGLFVSMNYKIEGRPYAYGEITPIYGTVRAQDTVLNQSIEVINRYLRPTIFVNDPDADLDSMMLMVERGGIGYGDYTKMGSPEIALPPGQAFQSIDTLQQAIERTTRWSPYASGLASQQTDKTQGTATGITSLQRAAEPNFQVKLDAVQDSWLEPLARSTLKMIGAFMKPNKVRYSFLRGEDPKWVEATKGIITGKATIGDMVTVGMINPDELQDPEFVSELLGQFNVTNPNDLLEKTVVFDVDWIIKVKLDSQAATDKEQEIQAELALVQMGMQMGVQYNPERVISYFATKRDFKAHASLLLTDEEKQEQQQAQIASQEQELAMNQRAEAAKQEFELQKQQAGQAGEIIKQFAGRSLTSVGQ